MDDLENLCVLDEASGNFVTIDYSSKPSETLFLDEFSGCLLEPACVDQKRLTNIVQNKQKKSKTSYSLWQQNIRQNALATGQSYVDRNGKIKPAKFVGKLCNDCRLHCGSRLSPQIRQKFFEAYYKLTSMPDKHKFLLKYTRTFQTRFHGRFESRRELTRKYFIGSGIIENGSETMILVCRKTFLNTLNISDKSIRTAYRKFERGENIIEMRGHHERRRSDLDLEQRLYVKEHIKSFPLCESHYCRAQNSNRYLDSELTVPKMYELYRENMQERDIDASLLVSISKYRDIFKNEFDLKFNNINKDACDNCVSYKNASSAMKIQMKNKHDEHLQLKNRAREIKTLHKLTAQTSNTVNSCVYDYQKGLQLPKAEASSFYYKRKLVVHNFTIFDLKSKDAYNYVYDESLTGVGPNEVCSFLDLYIKEQIEKGIKEFRFLSDNCGGQNHNQFVFYYYVYASAKYKIDITHTFLVKGHTQNEGDSVHSTIERRLRNQTLHTPSQVYQAMKSARKKHPYIVNEVKLSDLFDFKSLVKPNSFAKNADKEPVKFRNIREISLKYETPGSLEYRYDYDSPYKTINVFDPQKVDLHEPKQLREVPKGIPVLKKRDLKSLCTSNLIPLESQDFYLNLKDEQNSHHQCKKIKLS